ncbi:MAG TPA: DUF1501 domain-containing protein [Gemmatales bacterium]|nr:DUF1501 domain-containing protein [Gemmatales bacterium]
MLSLPAPGRPRRLCDSPSRREILQVGGIGLLGLTLPNFLKLSAAAAPRPALGGAGFGRAKSVIFLFLQGGPSHIDIWDPKPDAPDNIRSQFKNIKTKVPGIELTEVMPKLAQAVDRATLIRSMSYTPKGLFNHTAAIYQLITGYTPDRVSPSGQLEPPTPTDFPTAGAQIARLKPPTVPMLPSVMLPRPLQESNVINKGGTAGYLGKAYDPFFLFPPGDDNDQKKMERIRIDEFMLRPELDKLRLQQRQSLLQTVNEGITELEQSVKHYALDQYYSRAFELILSGRARDAFDLNQEPPEVRDRYGRHTFGQSCLLARRLVEAGTRFVQVNWPSVANGDPVQTAWDTHASNFPPLKDLHCPKLDSALATLLEDLDNRGLLAETLVVALGEFGRSPRLGVSTSGNGNAADGRDHWPYCYTALVAGAGVKRGTLLGRSDQHGSSPVERPIHPTQILATVYHALGIDPATIVYNHLNQPRELVQAEPVLELF